MKEPTFELSLEDAEFVVEELPWDDEFTKNLRRWVERERDARDARAEQERERAERMAPIFNAFIWRVVGGEPEWSRER